MSLFIYVLADLIHLAKIIVLCDMCFVFLRRKFEHSRLLIGVAGIVMSGVSIFIDSYDNHLFETFIYNSYNIVGIYAIQRENS